MTKNRPTRWLLYPLLITMLLASLHAEGWAMLAPASTGSMLSSESAGRAADMKTVQTALESKVVRARLQSLGLTNAEIDSRMNRLTDAQVHQLAKDVKAISSGGDGGLLVLVILILLIVYLFDRI